MRGDKLLGRIFQINVSEGGLPKLARFHVEVRKEGILGDKQRDTLVHGGPMRAICVYSLEKINALQEEGHPIYPGAIGENLTLSGIDWEKFHPGILLKIAEKVLIEVTSFTSPCSSLTPYFINGDYSRVSQKVHPGWARVYASVIEPGYIGIGDPVVVQQV